MLCCWTGFAWFLGQKKSTEKPVILSVHHKCIITTKYWWIKKSNCKKWCFPTVSGCAVNGSYFTSSFEQHIRNGYKSVTQTDLHHPLEFLFVDHVIFTQWQSQTKNYAALFYPNQGLGEGAWSLSQLTMSPGLAMCLLTCLIWTFHALSRTTELSCDPLTEHLSDGTVCRYSSQTCSFRIKVSAERFAVGQQGTATHYVLVTMMNSAVKIRQLKRKVFKKGRRFHLALYWNTKPWARGKPPLSAGMRLTCSAECLDSMSVPCLCHSSVVFLILSTDKQIMLLLCGSECKNKLPTYTTNSHNGELHETNINEVLNKLL